MTKGERKNCLLMSRNPWSCWPHLLGDFIHMVISLRLVLHSVQDVPARLWSTIFISSTWKETDTFNLEFPQHLKALGVAVCFGMKHSVQHSSNLWCWELTVTVDAELVFIAGCGFTAPRGTGFLILLHMKGNKSETFISILAAPNVSLSFIWLENKN